MSNNQISTEHEKYLKEIKKRRYTILVTQITIFIIGLFLWEIAARFDWIDTFLTSYPSGIWKLFVEYTKNGDLFYHVGISVLETIIGFASGTLLGILIAIVLWWSDFWAKVLDPYLVVLNSLPKTALAPIIIIWVGAGYSGIIVTAITISIVVTIMNMFVSFTSVDEDKIKLLQTFGANKFQILKKVVLPYSIPTMISTLKVNIGLSWVGVIVGEFLVSKAGIGYLIVYGGQVFKLDLVMMSVFILAIISAFMYKGISLLEDKFMKWQD
ncbi:NitT/TauT family transport system permease protein [Keratinibaculum paraultunense]|uniref:NitT/TauT family transport system permease protein n=1 Tax=Keratinibaculum paraultunense TaxID=1278232 RepID=A0A4R3KZC3_9FIRM|nr:ABC transporter permease [Keratinibaculum paraultunense]QQY80244.1 ABC transporter permease [Keratinibaculum paraultunense]TCS90757.1 NitT/TauT family transport system permease protein [Keratinibaculum paraultunense]